MSTYSWSYKNASHRQLPVKKPAQDVAVAPSSKTKETVVILSSDDTTTNTDRPKRLNWRAKLYVGNLNKKTTEASLAYYFSVFGDLDEVKLIRDHSTNVSRGFAFITYDKVESAEKAKKWCCYNYPMLDDSSITVASAERKVKKPVPSNEIAANRDPNQTLFWEYKWKNEDGAQVYGPYETSLMLAWKNQCYFNAGCWVRQVHRGASRIAKREENAEGTADCLGTADRDETRQSLEVPEDHAEDVGETPSKKIKLVIDYSDSDEDGDEMKNDKVVESKGEEKEGRGEEIELGSVADGDKTQRSGRSVEQYAIIKGESEVEAPKRKDEKKNSQRGFQEARGRMDVGGQGLEKGEPVVDESKQQKDHHDGNIEKMVAAKPRQDDITVIDREVEETIHNLIGMVLEREESLQTEPGGVDEYLNTESTRFEKEHMTEDYRDVEDYFSSSDDEDVIDNTDVTCTEFVHISEIDFSFFP